MVAATPELASPAGQQAPDRLLDATEVYWRTTGILRNVASGPILDVPHGQSEIGAAIRSGRIGARGIAARV
jgi:hypothetical protein